MSLNPGGASNYSWNYSNPNKEGYSTQLVGTVIAIQEVQKRSYTMNGQPGQPEFWPDGNPKMNIRLALATETGEIKTFTFQPAGKDARAGRKRSVHMDLFALTGNTDMKKLIGQTIAIITQEGRYGQNNPRPWTVQLVDAGPFSPAGPVPAELKVDRVLANSAAAGGQVTPPQQVQQPNPYGQGYQQQPMQPQYQQPMRPQPAYAPQPQYQQPAYNVPQQQPMYQPQPVYTQPAPQSAPQLQYQPVQTQVVQPEQQVMDPNIMAAMASQAFGGPVTVDVIPAQPTNPVGAGEVYDEDMPF